ncbi:MAG: GGDEF domain-containing protein [Candidatus Pacearchaeota archaeon]
MLKKSARFQRMLHVFVFLAIISAILFALFSYVTVKTNVSIIRDAVNVIKGAISGTFIEEAIKIEQTLSRTYTIIIAEIIIFLAGIVTSLFAVLYLIDIYFIATRSSLIDELTGIYNRRAIYKILDQEIKRAERFRHPLSIMMMDIDFFKNYNDKNGHVAGDILLQKISKIISSKIRNVDTLGRYGGEEFLVILPETSHEGAARVGEKIRKVIENTRFKGGESQPKGKVTISIGLVTFHGEYGHRAHLIHSADVLLYKAKEEGRNQMIKEYYQNHSLIKEIRQD